MVSVLVLEISGRGFESHLPNLRRRYTNKAKYLGCDPSQRRFDSDSPDFPSVDCLIILRSCGIIRNSEADCDMTTRLCDRLGRYLPAKQFRSEFDSHHSLLCMGA